MLDLAKKVLVVAAHPDDMEAVAGGTVALLTGAGAEVHLLLCTSGDLGSHEPGMTRALLASTREAEAVVAGKLLGVENVYFLRHTDGELQPTLELRSEIAGFYRRLQVDTILTFDPYNRGQVHADHRAAGQAALDAFMPAKMPLYFPEQLSDDTMVSVVERIYLFGTDQPNLWIDIGTTIENKVEAMFAHTSQAVDKDQFRGWLTNGALESARDQEGVEYAEAFQKIEVW